jgi:flagellar assembly protein FliH
MSSEILPNQEQPEAIPVSWRVWTAPVPQPPPVVVGEKRKEATTEPVREPTLPIEQIRQEAFAAGVRQAEQQILPALDGLARTIAELSGMRQAIREETVTDLVKLATTIAARVIHREIAIDPDALAGLVQAAFQKLQSREIHRVRMHPGLEPMLVKCLQQLGAPKNVVIAADPTMHPGELVFETSQGALDTSVDTVLGEIERGLIDKLER